METGLVMSVVRRDFRYFDPSGALNAVLAQRMHVTFVDKAESTSASTWTGLP